MTQIRHIPPEIDLLSATVTMRRRDSTKTRFRNMVLVLAMFLYMFFLLTHTSGISLFSGFVVDSFIKSFLFIVHTWWMRPVYKPKSIVVSDSEAGQLLQLASQICSRVWNKDKLRCASKLHWKQGGVCQNWHPKSVLFATSSDSNSRQF